MEPKKYIRNIPKWEPKQITSKERAKIENSAIRLQELIGNRRTIWGPNRQKLYIPKHSSIKEVATILTEDYQYSSEELSRMVEILDQNPKLLQLITQASLSKIEPGVYDHEFYVKTQQGQTQEKAIEEMCIEKWREAIEKYETNQITAKIERQMEEKEAKKEAEKLSPKAVLSLRILAIAAAATITTGLYFQVKAQDEQMRRYDEQLGKAWQPIQREVPDMPQINKNLEALSTKSKLYSTLHNYVFSTYDFVEDGQINSYKKLEKALQEEKPNIYVQGPNYFSEMARDIVEAIVMDKYEQNNARATYDIKEDGSYDFYVRYKEERTSKTVAVDRVNLRRNEKGRIEAGYGQKFPTEFYEVLTVIGEMQNYISERQGNSFSVADYAEEHTNGDIELARHEIKERLKIGFACINSLIENRAKEDQWAKEQEKMERYR